VRPGDKVRAAEPLAEIQSAEFENLQLELLNAQSNVRLSEQLVRDLEKGGVNVAEQSLADAENRHRQNQQALANAKSKWTSLGLDDATLDGLLKGESTGRLTTLPVRAPIGGTIVHADLSVGKIVESNEHLFEIVDLAKIWAKIDVLEHDLRHIAPGLKAELQLTAYPGRPFAATVHLPGLYLEPESHVNAVWAELENSASTEPTFLPGMTGQARVFLPARASAMRVPAAALVDNGVDRFVFVEIAEASDHSQYRRQSVEVLRQTPTEVIIAGGSLFPGDRVLTDGSQILAQSFEPNMLRLTNEMSRSIGLQVEPVRQRAVEEVLELEGAVEILPERRAVAASLMNGTIQAIHVELGQKVKAGEVLAEIASLEVQNLQLEFLKEHLDVTLLEQQLQRVKDGGAAVARRRQVELESALNTTRNRRESLRQRLMLVGFDKEQVDELQRTQRVRPALPVKAAVSGAVVHFDKVLGQSIRAEEPLFELHNPGGWWLRAYVPERAAGMLKPHQQARVRFVADPDTIRQATLVRSSRVFASESRVAIAWFELGELPTYPLRHGQLARLTLTRDTSPPLLAVPHEAIVTDGLLEFVFVANADGTFSRRGVTTGKRDDRWVEIRNGLTLDERIATTGAGALQTAHAAIR